jgi:hypothetical protein
VVTVLTAGRSAKYLAIPAGLLSGEAFGGVVDDGDFVWSTQPGISTARKAQMVRVVKNVAGFRIVVSSLNFV